MRRLNFYVNYIVISNSIYSQENIHSGSNGTLNVYICRWIPQQYNERRVLAIFYDFIFLHTGRSKISYIKICCNYFWTRTNNFVRYVKKLLLVLRFSFKQPDGIPLVQSYLEILPVIMQSYSGADRVQCCLWFHESQSFTSVRRKFRTKYHKKNAPKNDCCSVVQAVRWNLLCLSQGARPGSILCPDETIESVRQTFVRVHEHQLSAPFASWLSLTLLYVRFCRNDCVASHTDYNWCKLWTTVTKKNDMRFVVKCLKKWKKKISWIIFCVVKRLFFMWVVMLIVITGYTEFTWDRRTCVWLTNTKHFRAINSERV
jgi:hypothetical protein